MRFAATRSTRTPRVAGSASISLRQQRRDAERPPGQPRRGHRAERPSELSLIGICGCRGGTLTAAGALDSAAGQVYHVDFFASPSCNPSGNGEGKTFLGSSDVTTDGSGHAAFSVPLPAASGVVTATATDPNGSTSEFSACQAITGNTFVVNTASDHDDGTCNAADCTLREAIAAANANPGPDAIHFNIGAGGLQTITLDGTLASLPSITDPVTIDGRHSPVRLPPHQRSSLMDQRPQRHRPDDHRRKLHCARADHQSVHNRSWRLTRIGRRKHRRRQLHRHGRDRPERVTQPASASPSRGRLEHDRRDNGGRPKHHLGQSEQHHDQRCNVIPQHDRGQLRRRQCDWDGAIDGSRTAIHSAAVRAPPPSEVAPRQSAT